MVKPALLITIGDYNGIGPELALKCAEDPSVRRVCTPVLVGPGAVFEETARRIRIRTPFRKTNLAVFPKGSIPIVDVGDAIGADIAYGAPTKSSGKNAGLAIERAVDICLQGKAAAMVTAPVSKEGLALAGYAFPGQTEMVALLSRSQKVAMMLIGPNMRIGLVTVHAPLRSVADQLSVEKIVEKVTIVYQTLRADLGIRKPRVALLALNPHAGENGMIGTEEQDLILPAMRSLEQTGIMAHGPFPADAFFGQHAYRSYDAVVAMYHDQGLIPLKMAGFETGVNYSAGLPIVRTSPDHGTAYDIAGKNKASTASMVEAILLACRIARQRQRP